MKVVISRKIPGEAEQMLKAAGHEVVYGTDFAGAEAILTMLTDKIDGGVMDAAGKQLKIIANYAVGFDNIDLEAAKQRNIFVTNTPGGFERSVAEHAVGLMLAVARRIVEADKFVRANEFDRWDPNLFIGTELAGKTLGIVGLGRIGTVMAEIASRAMGMKVLYFCPERKIDCEKEFGLEYCSTLLDLLAKSDVVSLHVPLTPGTKHMIGAKEISAMKKTAILINTARGAVVDELALAKALSEKWIAGAGLDVFEDETRLVTESEKILYSLDNVVLTPHIASATVEARTAMSKTAAENIIAALSGQTPPDLAK